MAFQDNTYQGTSLSTAIPYEDEDCQEEILDEQSELVHLENNWTFWFERFQGGKDTVEEYAENISNLGSFGTVQDFWRFFNNLPTVLEIPEKSTFHLMKDGSRPLWEDPSNIQGGNLSFRVKKAESEPVWLQLLLRAIGEQFFNILHEDDDIQGISVNNRAGPDAKFHIWTSKARLYDHSKMVAALNEFLPGVHFVQEPSYVVHHQQIDIFKSNVASPAKPSQSNNKFNTPTPKKGFNNHHRGGNGWKDESPHKQGGWNKQNRRGGYSPVVY